MTDHKTHKAWFCIVTNENWEKIKRYRIWGVPDTPKSRSKVKLIGSGDLLVFYLKLPTKAIVGTSRVASEVYTDRHNSPWDDREYPYRVRLDSIKELSKPIPFSAFGGKLSKIKSRFSLFGNSIIPLSERDLRLLHLTGTIE